MQTLKTNKAQADVRRVRPSFCNSLNVFMMAYMMPNTP